MTDLTTRIADALKKAEKATPGPWRAISDLPSYAIGAGDYRVVQTPNQNNHRHFGASEPWLGISDDANANYIAAASPNLFIEMADEIDRLKAQLEKAREALEPFALAAASYDKCKPTRPMRFVWEFDKTLEVGHLRTAARVHAEIAEKEKADVRTR